MASIKEYIWWRGDLAFFERPFNDVDNVVMASLAYVDFGAVVSRQKRMDMTVASALSEVVALAKGDVSSQLCSMVALDEELMHLIVASRRFGPVVVRDYVDVVDCTHALQFSATTFDTPDDLTIVAFRGTDHSLVGWRENFMLGFKITEAQKRAADYLKRAIICAAEEGRKVVVCGHSKGGNLAAYAATVCPDELRCHIAHVWSDDGPGMAAEVMPTRVHETLGERYTHIVPRHSVVGMLFADAADTDLVVASSAKGMLQHDPTTWEVDVHGFIPDELASDSYMVAAAFSNWLDEIDLASREIFVNELFDALAAGNPTRIDAVLASPASTQRVISAAVATSVDTRTVAAKLASAATSTATGAVRATAQRAADAAISAAREMLAEAQEALRELVV